jgi:hypothetical protein
MSSAENDLTQGLLAEARRKDELLDAYREKVVLLESIISLKDERIKNLQDHVQTLLSHIDKSNDQFDKVVEVANQLLK